MPYRSRMHKLLRAGAALALVALLAGCAPATPRITPQPVPSATPLFASDEEALAAAVAAYSAYVKMSDTILAEGGANAERLIPFVASSALAHELAFFSSFSATHSSATGLTKLSQAALQQLAYVGNEVNVTFYICSDISSLRILDANRNDITPLTRINRQVLEVELESAQVDMAKLVVVRSDPWSNTLRC